VKRKFRLYDEAANDARDQRYGLRPTVGQQETLRINPHRGGETLECKLRIGVTRQRVEMRRDHGTRIGGYGIEGL
jgi:hypothetical protein